MLLALDEVKYEVLAYLNKRKNIEILKLETRQMKKRDKSTGLKATVRSLANEHSRGRIIDVYFKPDKVLCEYCQSNNCKHVEFALSLPEARKILSEKGWEIRKKSRKYKIKTLRISDDVHRKMTATVGTLMAQTGKMQTYQDAIEAMLTRSVVLPTELLAEIENFIETNKHLGYITKEEFIRDSARWRLNFLKKESMDGLMKLSG